MIEKLLDALKSAPSISAWKVNIKKTESCELFYVQKKVETTRATNTVDYDVTIYVDKDGKRGQSSFAVYPYMSKKEILALVEQNVFAASFTFNTFYEIPSPSDEGEGEKIESNLSDKPFVETIGEIGKAIMEANNVKDASLSATEVFLYKIDTRVINSNGIDVSSTSYQCKIETIPNFVKGSEEYEIYKEITFASFDPEQLTKKVAEAIELCRDRANATQLQPFDNIPVIIQDQEVGDFFSSFGRELSYESVYNHSNLFNVGDQIQKDRTGDPLNIELRPFVKGALSSKAVDSDGVKLHPIKIVEDGKAIALHGSFRFGYYLGEKKPTGSIPITCVPAGTATFEDFKKKPYVRCVTFSGIQIDASNGFIGGEVRLGYYFDGEKEVPVTGFSIQLDYLSSAASFRGSKETTVLDNYAGPRYVYFPAAKIA